MTRQGIRCMLMRGGTSKGAYFLDTDLPSNVQERDDLLLRIMGSPDPARVDGLGGGHPLTSQVAIVSSSKDSDAFAIERGLVESSDPFTRIRVKTLNTGTRAELVISTPGGQVRYSGSEHVDGVPGTAAAIPIEHPSGVFAVRLETGGNKDNPIVERAGIVRTARAIFDGCAFPRYPVLPQEGSAA